MSLNSDPILDCYITPGILAIIVVVVVTSVVLAYFIAIACVRAWDKKSTTYMYCDRCNQFLGSLNVVVPPHALPGLKRNTYDNPNPQMNINSFHDVPDIRVNMSDHDNRPPTGTFQRLGMRFSRSNRSSTFATLEAHELSPIQASPPDKVSPTSGLELLTPVPSVNLPKYINQPGSHPSSVENTRRRSTPNDPSTKRVATPNPRQSPGKGATCRSVQSVTSDGEQENTCLSGADSVFYEDGTVGGDCRHRRDVSKMSQVRILASPPLTGVSKHIGTLITKTPANASKSRKNLQSMSCQPQILGRGKVANQFRSSIRSEGQARKSVRSEGSGKSRRSFISRKLKMVSDDRRPKNSKDTHYSPLINQNPTTTEDSCGIRSAISEEDQPLLKNDLKGNNNGATKQIGMYPKKAGISADKGQDTHVSNGLEQEGNSLMNNDPSENQRRVDTANNGKEHIEGSNTGSVAKKNRKRGSPGNTGNVSIPTLLVDIDIDGPEMINQEFESTEHICDSCNLGDCRTHKVNNIVQEKRDQIGESGSRERSELPTGQDLGTKSKVRTSSSARKGKYQYLGKRPGLAESDITSQSEDERPGSRLQSLRRNHLAGMSQSEEDEVSSRKQRENLLTIETPSQSPQYPVQTSTYVTTKRGPPTPSSLPICTPKFVTVRPKNDTPNTSNYPPNSWDSKQEFSNLHNPNLPTNSWDPLRNQESLSTRPLDLSASPGQTNLSVSSCINNNLSVTAMDNSTPAEGNHTSSPHSSAHLSVFKPVDLSMSIPGLDASLQLSSQDREDGDRSALPTLMESSPPLVPEGRYRHPLNNTMKLPLPSNSAAENPSHQVQDSNIPVRIHDASQENLPSPHDMPWTREISGNLDNSTGKLSQDLSRGTSMDSTSTLVPSPVNPNTRHQSQVLSPTTPSPGAAQSVPSPQPHLIPRPLELMQEARSMPPVPQWSRVKEHALPPSLPPPAPKARISGSETNSYLPPDFSHTPGQNGFQGGFNENFQGERSMPPAPQSSVKEHVLHPSLPSPAPKTRISGSEPHSYLPTDTSPNPRENGFQGGGNPFVDKTLDMPKESGSSVHDENMQGAMSMPPTSQWSRVKEHALPPSLPPPAPKTRISISKPNTPRENGFEGGVNPLVDMPKDSGNSFHDKNVQGARSLPPAPQWSRVREHALPPSLPPLAPRTRMSSSGKPRYLPKGTSLLITGGTGDIGGGNPLVEVPQEISNPEFGVIQSSSTLQGESCHNKVSSLPGRSMIPQPSRSQSTRSHVVTQTHQIRTRSTTESSQPPSLSWDSYDSDPTFVPRREVDLDDYTWSTTSESELENNNANNMQNLVNRSDANNRQNSVNRSDSNNRQNSVNRSDLNNRQNLEYRSDEYRRNNRQNLENRSDGDYGNNRGSIREKRFSRERNVEFQASSYVQAGVRTRSQSK